MNPGPTEEAGQTARTFLDVMRGQPLALLLGLSNIALLAFLYYQGAVAAAQRSEETRLLYENRAFVGNLLANCVPQQSQASKDQFEKNNQTIENLQKQIQQLLQQRQDGGGR